MKAAGLATLGTEGVVGGSTAAQLIAAIAEAEIPKRMWDSCIPTLLSGVTTPGATEPARVSALEAIGYICERIDPSILEPQANQILTSVVQCMRKEEPSNKVKSAATRALDNSLEFIDSNFQREAERNVIMQVVCETTQVPDEEVATAALQVLVRCMTLHYDLMEPYMKSALFGITVEAMKSPSTQVKLQGIEFWSNVCDEELQIKEDLEDAVVGAAGEVRKSKLYALGAQAHIAPLLTSLMTQQEDGEESDEWTVSKAAAVSLQLLSQTVGDAILEKVVPFVQANLGQQAWQLRDAAVQAFGIVLDGPETDKTTPLAKQALTPIMGLMKDPNPVVRDSVAYVIGRVCELLPDAVIPEFLEPVTTTLVEGLAMEPRVAVNICWAIHSLTEATHSMAEQAAEAGRPMTNPLSVAYTTLMQKLFATADRPDATHQHLRSTAYETITSLVEHSPHDFYAGVQQVIMTAIQRLETTVTEAVTAAKDKDKQMNLSELQISLCPLLIAGIQKLSKADVTKVSDKLVEILLAMLRSTQAQEEVLMVLSAIADSLEKDFERYLAAVAPVIVTGLKNVQDGQVCSFSAGLVGDIARALNENMLKYCDGFMSALLTAVADGTLDRAVKPDLIAAFADVAMAVGPQFQPYLEPCLEALHAASMMAAANQQDADYDEIDFHNELREGCLEAYTGILQALKGNEKTPNPAVQLIAVRVQHIVAFIRQILLDRELNDPCIRSACGLIGDLCEAFGEPLQPHFPTDMLVELYRRGRRSKQKMTKKMAGFCREKYDGISKGKAPLQW